MSSFVSKNTLKSKLKMFLKELKKSSNNIIWCLRIFEVKTFLNEGYVSIRRQK